MHDRTLYAKVLGIKQPWFVIKVELDRDHKEVRVVLAVSRRKKLPCPECGKACSRYDSRERRWRHLDTCQYRTILMAKVPRVRCPSHGVRQVTVPWSEPGSQFTALFEAFAIDWLREASISAVARQLRLSWDATDGILQRAVERGLARRAPTLPERIGVDEKAFRRGHDYVTIVSDQGKGTVLYVADARKQASLDGFYKQFEPEQRAAVKTVAMDMWQPYIASTKEYIPDADQKIAFDKFHIAKHLCEAVDKIRRQENKKLSKAGDHQLKGTKYSWLKNPGNMSKRAWTDFTPLRKSKLRTARGWAIKEMAMQLWGYRSRTWAEKAWKRWYSWAIRCRLEPIKKVARMVKRHWEGILTAVTTNVTNAGAEGINSAIQRVKGASRGFRNPLRFKNAIYFHLGGLDLYPASVEP